MENVFAYLFIFSLFFSAVLKVPNLRFESASLTSSKRLFEELIKALHYCPRKSVNICLNTL